MKNLDSLLKSRDITLLTKVHIVKAMVFPVVMDGCEFNRKEGWAPKNWCFRTVVLEKTLESHLDSKEIKPGNPEGNQSWLFLGRTDAKAEVPILWPPDWCWERLKAGEEGDDRGWYGWMVSLTQWTRVWASSRRWWKTGRPGMLQSVGLQRVGHDWMTDLNLKF